MKYDYDPDLYEATVQSVNEIVGGEPSSMEELPSEDVARFAADLFAEQQRQVDVFVSERAKRIMAARAK